MFGREATLRGQLELWRELRTVRKHVLKQFSCNLLEKQFLLKTVFDHCSFVKHPTNNKIHESHPFSL